MDETPFKPEFFSRVDEADDAEFYAEPRLVVHIDDWAIEAARRTYGELLPAGGSVLDLMSSWRSHLPDDKGFTRFAGIGMNGAEMRDNPQLTEWAVQDLNADPSLPYRDGDFDGAVCTVSVQYMTRPVELFREVGRVLRPGAPFVLTYSNRCFPTKAVRIWTALDEREKAGLIGTYFKYAGGFGDVSMEDRSIDSGHYNDPLYAVWALKSVRE
jgi:hypothetical protein